MISKRILPCMTIILFFTNNLLAAEDAQQANSTTLFDVIIDGGFISILIWLMLFGVSLGALLLCIHCLRLLKKSYFFSDQETAYISQLIKGNNLKLAMVKNGNSNSAFARVLDVIFKNIRKGEDKAGERASQVLEEYSASINRHIGTLQMCGNIAPMLGLLGTVTGMVSAFMGLGAAVGAEKASALAISISQALYTTAAGLLIAVPALVVAHLARNKLDHLTSLTATNVEQATAPIWNRSVKNTTKKQ